MKRFFRVCNSETEQGLWYHFNGEFSGFIHDRFKFCANSNLQMEFDPELVGWLSAVETIEDLYKWFTKEDILALQEHGWHIYEYEVETSKFYERFQHHVICQKTSRIIKKHIINEL